MNIVELKQRRINSKFNRSNWFPLPRKLIFPYEESLLKKWATHKKVIVEIGVFEGASAKIFISVMKKDGVLHLIDPYLPDSVNTKLIGRRWMARLNLALAKKQGRIAWHADYSYNVAKTWPNPIDLLFIDGDHSREACLYDWESWYRFVSVGGVVLFHDARCGRDSSLSWDGCLGPTKVVEDLFRGDNKIRNWGIVDEGGTIVVVQRFK